MKKILLLVALMLFAGSVKAVTYNVGDEVSVNNIQFYVLGVSDGYYTLLKKDPLTVAEVNLYGGSGTSNNHINRYTDENVGTAYEIGDSNNSGGMVYYSSATCGYAVPGDDESWDESGCITEYNNSDIKYVVDAWASAKFRNNELKTVDGYSARLIKFTELQQYYPNCNSTDMCRKESTTPAWIYNSGYIYWTMSTSDGSANNVSGVWGVYDGGNLVGYRVLWPDVAVRPVVNVFADKINTSSEDKTPSKGSSSPSNNTSKDSTVSVENTSLNKSLLTLIIGLIAVVSGVSILIYNKKRS